MFPQKQQDKKLKPLHGSITFFDELKVSVRTFRIDYFHSNFRGINIEFQEILVRANVYN